MMRACVVATLVAAALAACVSADDGLTGGALLKSSLAVRQEEDFLSARAVCLNATGDQYGACFSLHDCCETSVNGCCGSSQQCCYDNVGGCCPARSWCCGRYCCDESQVCVSGTCQSSSFTSSIFPGALLIGTLITGIIIIVLNVALLINDSIISARCRRALARISAAGPQWSPSCGLTQELHQVATTRVFLMTVQRKRRFAVIAIVFHVLSLVLAILALGVFYILMYPAYFLAFVGLSCSIASSCMRGASHDQLRRLAAGSPNTTVAMTFMAQPQAVPVATAVFSSTGAPSPYPQAQYAAPPPQMQAQYPSQPSPYPPQMGQYPMQQAPYPPQQADYPPAAYAPGYAQPNAPPPAYDSTVPNY